MGVLLVHADGNLQESIANGRGKLMATTTWPAEVYVFDGTHWVSISPHGMTSLPPATGTTIGGVIAGSGVNVAPDGTISVTHFSGDYNDLTNKPVIQAPVQSDWLAVGGDAFIVNKPNYLGQFTNDLSVSAFPNDALYVDATAAAAAAPIQSIAAGANVAITDDGHGNITIAATGGGGSTPGGGVVSVSGAAPIKVVDGLNAPVISLVLGAGLKVNSGALEADVPDASTTTKGIIQIADAASITAGTALRAVDAAGLKAVTDQQTKDFVNVSGDTMTGALVIPDGTAAAPSLKFDDATGLFQPAANTWAVSTAGSERVRINSAGNVGIGRTAPASALDVNGVITVSPGSAAAPALVSTGGTAGVYFPAADLFAISAGGVERVRVGSLGNVGIGRTVPASALDVNGVITVSAGTAAAPALVASGDSDTGVWFPAANSFSISTAGLERLRVSHNGNVGIGPGETNPASTLSVRGVVASQAMRRHSSVSNYQIFSGVSDIAVAVYRDEGGMAIGLGNTGASTHTLSLQSPVKRSGNHDVGIFHKQDLTGSALISYGVWHQASYTDIAATRHYSFWDAGQSLNKSTLTTLVSFRAAASSSGVTNQRGFESVIDAGTAGATRHAFYASGSAPSFFAGNVGINDSNPSSKLVVNGDVAVEDKIIHYADPDTAIRFPSLDTFAIETGGSERLRVKSTGGVKYVPLATAPATPEQGEVYFDSTTKKLRVYDGTAWADLH